MPRLVADLLDGLAALELEWGKLLAECLNKGKCLPLVGGVPCWVGVSVTIDVGRASGGGTTER